MQDGSVDRPWRRMAICAALALALSGVAFAAKEKKQEKVNTRQAAAELMEGLAVTLPGGESFGRYQGPVRLALGEIIDHGYAETDDFLGVGPNATFKVTLASTRLDSVRQGVAGLLRSTGLEAASAETADYLLDVAIRRDRFSYDGDRLRGEVFLEFDFRRGEESAGRLLAYGNAETNYAAPNFTGLKKARPVYEAAFHDAFYKLVDSRLFRQLVGDGWTPGSRPDPGDSEIGRIDQDYLYLPIQPWPEIDELRTVLAGRHYERLVVQDFAILDKDFLQKARKIEKKACAPPPKKSVKAGKTALAVYTLGLSKLAEKKDDSWACDKWPPTPDAEGEVTYGRKPKKEKKAARQERAAHAGTSLEATLLAGVRPREFACEGLPRLIRERLEAFYPDAFSTIEHRHEWEPSDAIVVTGEIHRFNMGRTNSRLAADIQLKDGRTGELLYSLPVKMGGGLNWATGLTMGLAGAAAGAASGYSPSSVPGTMAFNEGAMQAAQSMGSAAVAPAMRDMEDDVARIAAFLLVRGLRPGHEPPPELEIAFDERSRQPTPPPTDEPAAEEVALATDPEDP